jgi:hypothetical protein
MSQQGSAGPESANRQKMHLRCTTCVYETGTDGGGVSVLSSGGTSVNVLSTDEVSAVLEDLQILLGEGPCVEATSVGRPVLVPDLDDPVADQNRRWPVFASEARKAGAGAVFAFPILVGNVPLGSVDLYRRRPGPLTAKQLSSGLRAVGDMGEQMLEFTAPELPGASSYPMTVHQAAGMVMVQLEATIDVAMTRLRACAFAEGVTMGDLAARVIDGERRFAKEEQ